MAKKKTVGGALLPAPYDVPAHPWTNLKYSKAIVLPDTLLDVGALATTAPDSDCEIHLWYDSRLRCLGWTSADDITHESVIKAVQDQRDLYANFYSSIGHLGEQTKTKPTTQWVIQTSSWQCALFIELRQFSMSGAEPSLSLATSVDIAAQCPWDTTIRYASDATLPPNEFEADLWYPGKPNKPGTYVFWYGPSLQYLGHSLKKTGNHTRLVRTFKDDGQETSFIGLTGRNGRSWAVVKTGGFPQECVFYMEVRELAATDFVLK
jgi:hypothetical protein